MPQGELAFPYPDEGFWALSAPMNHSVFAARSLFMKGQVPSNTTGGSSDQPVLQMFVPMGSAEVATDPPYFSCLAFACPEGATQVTMALPYFWECDDGHCKGGEKFECKER